MPLGEWLFFLTVPLACAYTWEMLTGGHDPRPPPPRRAVVDRGTPRAGATAAWLRGSEYTAFACAALAVAIALDLATGGRVTRHRASCRSLLVLAFTAMFNGYLTWRPLVLYDPRPARCPALDDSGRGLRVRDGVVIANVVVFERFRDRLGAPRTPRRR
jgi:hypothetical protein